MSDPLAALAERWRAKANTLAEYGDDRGAAICRLHATELEAAIEAAEDGLLTPSEAAEYAGRTERTLRQWRAEGRIENHGTDARPLYRRGDLPRRGQPDTPSGYDPRADALRLAS